MPKMGEMGHFVPPKNIVNSYKSVHYVFLKWYLMADINEGVIMTFLAETLKMLF